MTESNIMNTNRIEAFSDGVIAVIITIMVLELRAPENASFAALQTLLPHFLVYILSFITTGIFWNNHHHVMRTAKQVTPRIMWSNLVLLFWISLVPFATAWLGEHHTASWPTAFYGFLLVMSGLSFQLLQRAIIEDVGKDSAFARALGKDTKGKISLALYTLGIVAAFWMPVISDVIYSLVILSWFMPDTRVEKIKAEIS